MSQTPADGTPGCSALVVMQDLNNKEVIFKTPTSTVRKRKSQKVLDEDTYVEEMGKIIERDFFPDLARLRAQSDYLEAVERNDVVKIRELYATYKDQSERSRMPSPATFETPAHNAQSSDSATDAEATASSSGARKQSDKQHLSLDQFLNSHTSEDNESFEEIMAEAERKHREKFALLFGEEERSLEARNQQLALPSVQQQCLQVERKFALDTWTYTNRNYIMYAPEGQPLSDEQRAELEKRRLQVVHDNTRLTGNPFNDSQSHEAIVEAAKKQAQVLDGKIGVDGKELVNGTPRVNGFPLLRSPSPMVAVAESPLMTWGQIEGTPFRLEGGDTPYVPRTPGPAFKMNEPSKRERIGLALAEKASERHRDSKKKALDTAKRTFAMPSPYTSSRDRLINMSPAAQKLATSTLRLGTSGYYSPSPRRDRSARTPKSLTPSSSSCTSSSTTPRLNLGIKKAGAASEDHLTDDLLKINVPKRNRAADFF